MHGFNFYNAFAGKKSGFDPRLFDFLAERIAEAVVSAHAARRPAKIATGSTEIYGMTRNRSMEPFLTNPDLPTDGIDDPTRAVNPRMTMIRIDLKDDKGVYQPAGIAVLPSCPGAGLRPCIRSRFPKTKRNNRQNHEKNRCTDLRGADAGRGRSADQCGCGPSGQRGA